MTLARATLAVGVAALAADSFAHDTPVALLVTLAAVALALDAVDGWVARRTGTATALGARFDGEVDAFLILALSVYVAPAYGAWVLAIGAARYLFLAGEWLLPWMRAPLPPRRWRRVVAATQGVVLTVAAAEGPAPGAHAGPAGRRARRCSRRRSASARGGCGAAGDAAARGAPRGRCARASPWRSRSSPCCSSGPPSSRRTSRAASPSARSRGSRSSSSSSSPSAALLPATPRRVLAVVVGAVLSVLVLVKVLDIGFFTAFDRPFKPVDDSSYVGIGIETLRDAIGRSSADLVVAVAAVLIVALLALPVLALLRVTRVAAGHRGWALRAAAVLGVVWVALRVVGAPVASSSAAALAVDEVQAVRTGLAGSRGARPRDRPRPLPRHARRPAADRPAGQGRPARVRRELREGRGPGLVLLARRRRRARPGHRAAAGRRLLLAQRLPHLADVRRPQLAGALHPAVGDPGRRPAALRPARRERPPHPHPGVQARRVAGGRRHAGEPPGVAGGLELLPLRRDLRPPQPRLPRPGLRPAADARPVRPAGPAAPRARRSATGRRCSPRSTSSRATRRGRGSPGSSPGTTSATARSSTASRRRSPRRPRSSATPSGPAPPTGTRSSTR